MLLIQYRKLLKGKTMVRTAFKITVFAVIINIIWVFAAVTLHAETATLAINDEAFDLETGDICEGGDGGANCVAPYDFYFFREYPSEYLSEYLHLNLGPLNGAQVAFLDGVPFEDVDYQIASSQELTSHSVGPIDRHDTVVIFTADNNLFKVGNVSENGEYENGEHENSYYGGFVSFEYSELNPPIPFGEASFKRVPLEKGDKVLCINLATEEVFDCDNLAEPLKKRSLAKLNVKIKIENPDGGADIETGQLLNIKDDTILKICPDPCYSYFYNGFYYNICY